MKKNIVFIFGLLCISTVVAQQIYAATISKTLEADFNAGTYTDTDFQTLFGETGLQLNVSNGPEETRFKLPVTIDNTATTSARTDYVVAIPIDTRVRIQSGIMQSDCGDIRFRDADDSTALTEFEIRNCNTSSSFILLQVPSIPASATKEVYMYYGSPNTLVSQSSPQTPSPGEIFEDMTSAPSGTLKGAPPATYSSEGDYVELTTATNGVYGALEYTFNPGANFDATFDLWAGEGSGADATYLYVYSDTTPTTEYDNSGGYILQVNDLADYVAIQYRGEVLVTKYLSEDDTGVLTDAVVDDSQWHPIRMTKVGNRFRVYYENIKLIDYVDTEERDLDGPLTGVGARTGALNNIHRIRNLRVTQTVVSSDEEVFNDGSWQSPGSNNSYNLSNISDWGDGTSESTAFSASIATASSKAFIEFQVKTADTADGLSSAEYVSIGTASAGTTFTKTKQDLDDFSILAKPYAQIRTIFTRNLAPSAVLEGFSLTYVGTEQESNDTQNQSPRVKTRSATPQTCSDWQPVGTVDLFQINRSRTNAVLYFTPVNDNVKTYHVVYGFIPGDERFGKVGAHISREANNGVQSIVIDDLDPKASYWFKVSPVNGCAVGNWSNWLQARQINQGEAIFYRWFN